MRRIGGAAPSSHSSSARGRASRAADGRSAPRGRRCAATADSGRRAAARTAAARPGSGRHAVGRNHEVFDQFGRPVLLLLGEMAQRAVLEYGSRLDRRQRQRTLSCRRSFRAWAASSCYRRFSSRPGTLPIARWHRAAAIQPGPDARVGELHLIADQRLVDVRSADRPIAATT